MSSDPNIHRENPAAMQTVPRFQHDPLTFSGRLVLEATTADADPASDSRWLELFVFEKAESGFVAGIVFCTSEPGETTISTFEELDDASLVENFFFAFEPYEYLQLASIQLPDEALGRLASELHRKYEVAMREVITYLASRKESPPDVVNNQFKDAKAPKA